ncbi:hypothetical protein [Xanthomonas arboricola]|uniref:Uncharacterized protein n=1 Tax=Xanthomonas arboricola TaxID=56448 RepID=A0A2S7ADV9_9XANT|nr:hypothetical protein [Xanthomonas arboricola]PPU07771.1 hypothetical protein XarjCFBP7645_09200 [Xanthomonas arboricola]
MSNVTLWSWAVHRCAVLETGCEVDWDAWAAAAGWFGALGGWAAAVATVLAVVLPYRRDVKRSRYRAYVAMKSFRESLGRLSRRLRAISSIRNHLTTDLHQLEAADLDAIFGMELEAPLFDMEPELDDVMNAVALLRYHVNTWQQFVAMLKIGADDPWSPKRGLSERINDMAPLFDELAGEIQKAIATVEGAIDRIKFRPGRL